MTAVHISDELPRMLTGEASRDVVLAAAAHLRTCVDCQQELVSAVVAHASLTSAQRFAPEIVSGMLTGNFADASLAEPGAEDDEPAEPDDRALPDLSAVFRQVREEAAAPRHTTSRVPRSTDHHSSRTRYLVGAAAAVVLLGAGGAIYAATSGSDDNGSGTSATRTVKLAAYDTGKSPATARVGDGKITVNAASLPSVAGKRYEVWLTNDQRTRMQPVGWVGDNGTAALTVPSDVVSQFSDIEVSVQPVDDKDYVYSNVSVLRGSLT